MEQKILSATSLFFHGGPIDIPTVKNEGIDAVKIRERVRYRTPDGSNRSAEGSSSLLSWLRAISRHGTNQRALTNCGDPAGMVTYSKYQSGSVFFSQGDGQPTHGKETAFSYKIESSDIKYYSTPSSDARERTPSKYDKSALNRNGTQQRAFQIVPWGATTAKLINGDLV